MATARWGNWGKAFDGSGLRRGKGGLRTQSSLLSLKASPFRDQPLHFFRYYILLLCQGSKLDSGGLLSRLYDKLKAEECLKK
ncbi:hypothetical protein GUJ93_ZPchr0458g22730 [Zizania palustris]|uniref:Uncharacterized protein n=1 Tax=Zizania palustris TaxID=103762 RepID=A0A8J5R2E0_ZIZPA|nr:hypothetical protein GUJ93_ZPchr0458g22730 [Zizania palustris]